MDSGKDCKYTLLDYTVLHAGREGRGDRGVSGVGGGGSGHKGEGACSMQVRKREFFFTQVVEIYNWRAFVKKTINRTNKYSH